MTKIEKVDIAVVGGGLAGGTLAFALAEKNFRVALIDASTAKEDARLIALNFQSIHFLKSIHLWDPLSAFASEIQQVHVSHRGHFGGTQLQSKEFQLPYLGYVVPAKHINQVLSEKLQHPRIEIFQPAKVTDILQNEEDVKITIQQKGASQETTASWVIAADGTQSTIRNLLKIPTETVDYQQSALVTITELKRYHENIAHERFLEQGAIAMLPLQENQAATIWTSHQKQIESLMALSDEDFLQSLQQHFGYRLGRFLKTNHRATYPLQYLRIKQQQVDKILLIGNAAHTLHPIAAQGLNLALFEIDRLCEQLTHSRNLSQFEFNDAKQKKSLQFSHQLNSIFSTDFFLFNTLRSLSMVGLDLFPSLKRKYILSLIQ